MEKSYLLKLLQEWAVKEYRRIMEGENSNMIYCKNFVNATMYPHPTQQ
jgi:hypothetical protein